MGINIVLIKGKVASSRVTVMPRGGKLWEATIISTGGLKKDVRGDLSPKTIELSVKAWDRGNATLAAICAQHCGDGSLVLIEGELVQEEWESTTGVKTKKHFVDIRKIEFL